MKQARNRAYVLLAVSLLILSFTRVNQSQSTLQSASAMAMFFGFQQNHPVGIVRVRCLSHEEQNHVFYKNNQILLDVLAKKEIIPVRIAITNKTEHRAEIELQDINLPLVLFEDIYNSIKTDSGAIVKRTLFPTFCIGGVAMGLSVWSFASISTSAGRNVVISGIIAGTFWESLAIGAVGVASLVLVGRLIKCGVMNRRIKNDLKEKMLHKKIVVAPGKHYSGLAFMLQADYENCCRILIPC